MSIIDELDADCQAMIHLHHFLICRKQSLEKAEEAALERSLETLSAEFYQRQLEINRAIDAWNEAAGNFCSLRATRYGRYGSDTLIEYSRDVEVTTKMFATLNGRLAVDSEDQPVDYEGVEAALKGEPHESIADAEAFIKGLIEDEYDR